MNASSILEAARRYTRAGISVLPIVKRSKFPDAEALRLSGTRNALRRLSWLPLTRRLATEAELVTWFATGERNIGIVTGFGDLTILDFDAIAHYQAWAQLHPDVANATCLQKTSKGVHVLFRWKDVRRTRFFVNQDVVLSHDKTVRVGQIKGALDYVVASPSIHPDGTIYSWLPGHAPWEVEVVRVQNLHELSIEPVQKPWWQYLGYIRRFYAHPREYVQVLTRWIKNKYAKFTGEFFRYG